MRRDDYIQAIASGLLTVPEDGFAGALAHFGQRFELSALRKPGVVSLAGQRISGETLGFADWIHGLRGEDVLRVSFSRGAASGIDGVPAHIAAGFTGGLLQIMHVSTGTARRSYVLQSLRSPQYELTAVQFAQLIDAQEHPSILWKRIVDLLAEGNALNGRRSFPEGTVAAYLRGEDGFPEGADVYDFMAGDLFREVQIECAVEGTSFHLPDDLKALFYQSSFSFGDEERDAVYLYPLRDVTAPEVQALIQAQPFDREVVWYRTAVNLQEFPPAGIPEPMAMGWELSLEALDAESFSRVVSAVCQSIRDLCEEAGKHPVIPAWLSLCFGPDEADAERARIRSRMQAHQWYLQGTLTPWELYLFAYAGETTVQESFEAPSWRTDFVKSLDEAFTFARSIGSPFAEAFRLGAFVLSENFALTGGGFDAAHEETVRAALAQNGFSDNAQDIFMRSFWLGEELHLLQWSPARICGLIALDITDVFGGMGSWNDIAPDGDAAAYQRITEALFQSRENFFAEMLEG